MIRAFAFINATTGDILNLQFPQGEPPEEGVDSDGIRTVIVTDDNLPEEGCLDYHYFIDNYAYKSSASSFIKVGHKPNNYATWNFYTNSWTWDADLLLADIRGMRNRKLFFCDWTVGQDSPLSAAKHAEARAYRSALRDITSTLDNPSSVSEVNWPTPPSFLS